MLNLISNCLNFILFGFLLYEILLLLFDNTALAAFGGSWHCLNAINYYIEEYFKCLIFAKFYDVRC